MNNEQILKKAIEKAVKNGCKTQFIKDWIETSFVLKDTDETDFHLYFGIIFSHDFAKAFWGEESIYNKEGMPREDKYKTYFYNANPENDIVWKWYLQLLVLEEEPLKYLEKFI